MASQTADRRTAILGAFATLALGVEDAAARRANAIETLSEAEMNAFTRHCDAFLGRSPQVLHELVSDDIHLDVLPYAPSTQRPYWTLVTLGASVRKMAVPAGVDAPARIELMITLPPDWLPAPGADGAVNFTDSQWEPGGAMKALARYVHAQHSWFGVGHTVEWTFSGGHPLAAFKGFALAPPLSLPQTFWRHTRADGEQVAVLALYPLYDDEIKFKLEKGADALLDRWAAAVLEDPVIIGRRSVVGRR